MVTNGRLTPTIQLKNLEGVLLMRMSQGVTNPLGPQLVSALQEAINKAGDDQDVKAVVLTGANEKFFSIGLDIPEIIKMDRRGVGESYDRLETLWLSMRAMPKPIVAALCGHAVGGGCALALACDMRLVSTGRRLIGLNAVNLGVPTPLAGRLMLRQTVDDSTARIMLEGGEFYKPREARRMGLVDKVVLPGGLLVGALKAAKAMAKDTDFAKSKMKVLERITSAYEKEREQSREEFLSRWFSPEAQARLMEVSKKFQRRTY